MGKWREHSWVLLSACSALASGCGVDEPDAVDARPSTRAGAAALPESRGAPLEGLAPNRFGLSLTINASGGPLQDPGHPFFQSLGTNGRSCSTCHVPGSGMTITPEFVQLRFEQTAGLDPLFRTVDGSNSPTADVSTLRARRRAFSLLRDRALIRVGIGIPSSTEFELLSVQDPYGFASAQELSLFRRPLPSTNLRFLSTVMWDGRETFRDSTSPTGFAALHFDFSDQSNSATLTHAQAATPLTDAQREAIIAFEMELFTAQVWDYRAGSLNDRGAQGGPAPS